MSILDELRVAGDYGDMNDVQLVTTLHQKYAPKMPIDEFAGKFGVKLPTRPSPLFSFVPDAIESGFRGAQQGTNLALNALGLQGDAETAARVSELERRKGEIAPQGSVADGLKAIQDSSKEGWGAAVKAIASNPQVLPRLIGESIGSFLPDIALAVATGGVAGPAAKALATRLGVKALAPEAISAAAKVATAAGVAGVGSAKTEFGAEILETFQEAGIDISSSSAFRKGLEDPELLARAQRAGLQKGIPVGLFDALSMGVAGRILDPAFEAARAAGRPISKATLAGRGAAELGLQAGLGAAGEASGQLMQKGRIDNPADVILEAVAEFGTGPVEALTNIRAARKQREEAALRQEQEKAEATQTPGTPEYEQQQFAEKNAQAREPFISGEERQRIEYSPTPIEEVVKKLGERYKLDEQQVEAILSKPEDTLAFLTTVQEQDPKAFNRVAPQIREYVEGMTAERQQLGEGRIPAPTAALPAPTPDTQTYQTPVGELTAAQADEVISRVADAPQLKPILDANLSAVEKRQQALATIFNADIQQARTGSTEVIRGKPGKDGFAYERTETDEADLDRVNAGGEVVPAEAVRQEELLNRAAESAKVSPEVAARAYEVYQPGMKVPAFQQAYKTATGQPLPLKPASVLAKNFNLGKIGPAAPAQQMWGNPPKPTSIPQAAWDRVITKARTLPKGRNLSIPQLTDLGLSQSQAEDARETLRMGGVLENFGNLRTDQPMTYSNVLSPSNALNFLTNELNGKNYGCM